jgi:hypothetical protein
MACLTGLVCCALGIFGCVLFSDRIIWASTTLRILMIKVFWTFLWLLYCFQSFIFEIHLIEIISLVDIRTGWKWYWVLLRCVTLSSVCFCCQSLLVCCKLILGETVTLKTTLPKPPWWINRSSTPYSSYRLVSARHWYIRYLFTPIFLKVWESSFEAKCSYSTSVFLLLIFNKTSGTALKGLLKLWY